MSRILALVIVTMLLAPAAIAKVDETRVICGFEKQSDVVRFELRETKPLSRLSLVSQRHSKGDNAGLIFFPKWEQDSQQWPAAILTVDKGLPADESGYDSIACDLYNASGIDVELALLLKDAAGKQISERFIVARDESRTVRLPFAAAPAGFDLKNVKEFQVYATRPPHDINLVIDQLRLESDVTRKLELIGDHMKKLRAESNDCAPEIAPLLKELDSTCADLDARAAKAADLPTLRALRPEILALETRLQTQGERGITEAKLRAPACKIAPNCPYACGFASGMQKVFPKDVAFQCSTAREAQVELAANETESIQLVVYAYGEALKNAQVRVGSLKSANGKAGPTAQLSPVGFVETKKPPYPVSYIGWYPDPILDFLKTFDVKKGEVEPIWIRVKAPAGTVPGDYRAQISVRTANAPETKLSLKVRVWGFELPKQTHLRTATTLAENSLRNAYGTITDSMRAKYEDFVLSYRLNPDGLYRDGPPSLQSLVRWNKEGLNTFNIIYLPRPQGLKPGDPYPADKKQAILDKIDDIVPELKKNGLYSKAYVYGFDEIGTESYAAMKDIYGAIKAKYPDLLTMTTGRDFTYGEASGIDSVDAWCPLTPNYNADLAKAARARGKQVWWYICVGNKAPFANWFVEYDAIDSRMLMGLQSVKYQPDGFLYYNMSRWPLTKKPITSGPYTDWSPASYYDFNGDGSIICAGPNGPLATIRLENIRDGIEDYEYFWLLRQQIARLQKLRSAKATSALKQTETALRIGDDLVRSMSSFSKSPDALLAKRRQVAAAILAARKVKR